MSPWIVTFAEIRRIPKELVRAYRSQHEVTAITAPNAIKKHNLAE